jgi:histidyl-tRNA synthetase
MAKNKLETKPYKGVRDFYPEDLAVQNYIFKGMRRVAERFGYEEYGASILEPAELYRAKTGEEIINEQTYTFSDRGGREVTLRPEMTPTVARMIAAGRNRLAFPVRWYSIQNFFRYEKPQKGRLREHWQLNADIFGLSQIEAEVEVVSLAYEILTGFGLKDGDFEIRLNNRKVMDYVVGTVLGITGAEGRKVSRLIDRKKKMADREFKTAARELLGENDDLFLTLLNSKNFSEFVSHLPENHGVSEGLDEITALLKSLNDLGITNALFDQTVMRGFDYYTGIVFEIFATDPENRRSLFGGGRYDNLLQIFGQKNLPAVGFGMGDVTIREILESHRLLPDYKTPVKLAVCVAEPVGLPFGNDLAQVLRREDVNVVVDYSGRRLGDQIKAADKKRIPFIACVGGDEVKSGLVKIKELSNGAETALAVDAVAGFLKAH